MLLPFGLDGGSGETEGPEDPNNPITQAAAGSRELARDELTRILEHVARAGFDPNARERARGALAGVEWPSGDILTGRSLLPPKDRHYLLHVREREEWPEGTSPEDYVESIRRVVRDPSSGAFTNRYRGASSLGIVRASRELRGPKGYEWILVQYRVETGHWTTAFQPVDGLDELAKPEWSDIRWLRRPRRESGQSPT